MYALILKTFCLLRVAEDLLTRVMLSGAFPASALERQNHHPGAHLGCLKLLSAMKGLQLHPLYTPAAGYDVVDVCLCNPWAMDCAAGAGAVARPRAGRAQQSGRSSAPHVLGPGDAWFHPSHPLALSTEIPPKGSGVVSHQGLALRLDLEGPPSLHLRLSSGCLSGRF